MCSQPISIYEWMQDQGMKPLESRSLRVEAMVTGTCCWESRESRSLVDLFYKSECQEFSLLISIDLAKTNLSRQEALGKRECQVVAKMLILCNRPWQLGYISWN